MKKNTPFLLLTLLAVPSFSYSMTEKDIKSKSEGSAAAAHSAAAIQASATPTLTHLLQLATSAVHSTEFPSNLPVTKPEIGRLIDKTTYFIAEASGHTEFTTAYTKDLDALAAKIVLLMPEIRSLAERTPEFVNQTKTLPIAKTLSEVASEFFEKLEKLKALKVIATSSLELIQEKRDKKHQALIEQMAKQNAELKAQAAQHQKKLTDMLAQIAAQVNISLPNK